MRPGLLAYGVLVSALVLAGTLALRYMIVEPRDVGAACQVAVGPWWCAPREIVIEAFYFGGVGVVAALCAAVALLAPQRFAPVAKVAAVLAMAVGVAGLTLYNAGVAGPAFLIGLMRAVRLGRAGAE